MKLNKVLLIITGGLLLLLSSCRGGYTCPTYAQDSENNSNTVEEYKLEKI